MKILTRIAVILGVVAIVAMAAPRQAVAHEGHDHLLMGTLTMVAADHIMVKVTDPKTKQDSVKTVVVSPTTKVFKGMPGTPAKAADLTTGIRVVVNIGPAKEPLTAKEIHIANAPTPGTK
jgi:hypothetical protein